MGSGGGGGDGVGHGVVDVSSIIEVEVDIFDLSPLLAIHSSGGSVDAMLISPSL